MTNWRDEATERRGILSMPMRTGGIGSNKHYLFRMNDEFHLIYIYVCISISICSMYMKYKWFMDEKKWNLLLAMNFLSIDVKKISNSRIAKEPRKSGPRKCFFWNEKYVVMMYNYLYNKDNNRCHFHCCRPHFLPRYFNLYCSYQS